MFTSLYLLAMLLLIHHSMWLDFFAARTHYRFTQNHRMVTSCCLLGSSTSFPPKLLSICLASSRYCCMAYSTPGAGLCIYLYDACVSPFLQSVEVPLDSSPALQCTVSSSQFDKSVYLLRVCFVSCLTKTLPLLFTTVKQHLHVFPLHCLQTISSFFN